MISLLLKLTLLRRIIVLIAAIAGTVPHWLVTTAAILGLGSFVGAVAVFIKRMGPAPKAPQAVIEQEAGSPFLLALAGLVIGGFCMMGFMVLTGR